MTHPYTRQRTMIPHTADTQWAQTRVVHPLCVHVYKTHDFYRTFCDTHLCVRAIQNAGLLHNFETPADRGHDTCDLLHTPSRTSKILVLNVNHAKDLVNCWTRRHPRTRHAIFCTHPRPHLRKILVETDLIPTW